MVSGSRAYDFNNEEVLKTRILTNHIPQLPKEFSNFKSILAMDDIYKLCMQKDQNDRPTVKDILSLDTIHEASKKIRLHIGGSRGQPKTIDQLKKDKKQELENEKTKLLLEKQLIKKYE